MSVKKVDPKIEWGFFAVVPRIVRTQYKDLTHADKWLYTCLKDLCGDKGTCFRTLRSLKEETDISIASLSTMIPKLHDAGLIHAEKKRRSNSGKEVWHITIVDVWQSNKEYCSKIEQSQDEIVQNLNNVVQNLNETPGDCSEFERDCSNFRYRRTTLEEQHIEERTIEEESIAVSDETLVPASAHDLKAELSEVGERVKKRITHPRIQAVSTEMAAQAQQDIADAPTKKMKAVSGKKPEAAPVPPEVMAVVERWFAAMNKQYPLTDGLLKAAALLVPCNPSVDDLKAVRGFCFKSNPKWFRDERKGAVTLLDIAKNWEAWQSSQEIPKQESKQAEQEQDEDYSDPEGFDRYAGNGKEERDARLKLYAEMKAKGELLV